MCSTPIGTRKLDHAVTGPPPGWWWIVCVCRNHECKAPFSCVHQKHASSVRLGVLTESGVGSMTFQSQRPTNLVAAWISLGFPRGAAAGREERGERRPSLSAFQQLQGFWSVRQWGGSNVIQRSNDPMKRRGTRWEVEGCVVNLWVIVVHCG